ncbi:glucose-6-phosphate isomerase [Cryobacterium sp. AP23]
MSFKISVSGAAAEAVRAALPALVDDLVASGITSLDPALWGPEAEAEAGKRLGWTESVVTSRPLVAEILALREELQARGVDHIALAGMGGSSLAPEVITLTSGVDLTVLDATEPGQVLAALGDRLESTALVVSSKSGGTVETDSQRRVFERAFRDIGIDPADRIIVVTDPGSPLEASATEAGYRVFTADPTVGGRFSALTAFGLVPSGLAGIDIGQLLDEADAVSLALAVDSVANPGLILGAAIAATRPRRDKLAIVSDGTHIVGLADWAEQLIAESTGKNGTGILPVVLDLAAPELSAELPDVQILRVVDDAGDEVFPDHDGAGENGAGEIRVSGTLGAQFLVWEYATVVAGRLLGINPFDQPDVESAKIATRGLLDSRPEPEPAAFISDGIEVRGTPHVIGAASDLASAVDALLEELGPDGYVAVQAYVDRLALPQLAELRGLIATLSKRPVTFGWGPRFLHSTGQFHKGGTPTGVFLQILSTPAEDLDIPDRPFTFGELIQAQAGGDASVLADQGRPVLTLTLTDPAANINTLFAAVR